MKSSLIDEKTELFFQSVLALTGSIFVWSGCWGIAEHNLFPSSVARDLAYAGVGLLILLLTRSFFLNVGLPTRADVEQTKLYLREELLLKHHPNQQHQQHRNQSQEHSQTQSQIQSQKRQKDGLLSPETTASPSQQSSESSASSASSAPSAGSCGYCCHKKHLVWYLRSSIALIGVILLWLGLYNLIDVYLPFPPRGIVKDIVCIVVGILCLIATRTLISRSGLDPITIQEQASLTNSKKTITRIQPELVDLEGATPTGLLIAYVKGFLALIGPIIMWVGMWNILEYHMVEQHILREIVYIVVGLIMLTLTGALLGMSMVNSSQRIRNYRNGHEDASNDISSSSISTDSEEQGTATLKATNNTQSSISLISLYFRSLIAFTGYLIFWTGLGMVLDGEYLLKPSIWRQFLWVLLGLVMLLVTDTFHLNAGVLTPMSYTTNLQTYAENMITFSHERHHFHTEPIPEADEDDEGSDA